MFRRHCMVLVGLATVVFVVCSVTAKATSVTLNGSTEANITGSTVGTYNTGSYGLVVNVFDNTRSVIEFSPASIPAGATVDALTFNFYEAMYANSSCLVNLYGFADNGGISAADATATATLLGSYSAVSLGPGSHSLGLTTSALQSVVGTSQFFALRLQSGSSDTNTSIRSLAQGGTSVPQMVVTYHVAPPTTLSLTPTVDFQATSSDGTHFTLADGGSSINTQEYPLANVHRRGVMEFPLASVRSDLSIKSASLALSVSTFTSGSDGYPKLSVYGYAGNGLMDTSDPTLTSVVIGQSSQITALGPMSMAIDPAFIQSQLGTATHLGMVAFDPGSSHQVGFYTTEGASFGTPPTLTITYGPMFGDANGDGKVDIADLSVLLTDFDKTGMAWAQGDFTGDGVAGIEDLGKLLTNFDKSVGVGITPVPEPSTLLLMSIGATFLAWRSLRS
jgi:hypothetical protein